MFAPETVLYECGPVEPPDDYSPAIALAPWLNELIPGAGPLESARFVFW